MSNLKNVVEELQNQQEGLNDVNSSIKELIKIQTDQLKSERRKAGDDLEQQIETNQKKKAGSQSTAPAPRSFAQGLGQGTGISALLGGVQGLFPSFAGALGGASLAGLLGKFTGRLVLGAAGFFLGQRYLDEHVDKLTNMLNLDTINIFGEDYDTSKIVSGLTGAFALVLGPAAIGAAVKRFFGGSSFRNQILGGPSGGAGPRRGVGFIGKLGLAGAVLTIGGLLGDQIAELVGGPEAQQSVDTAITTLAALTLFSPKVGIVAGITGLAIFAADKVQKFMDKKISELYKDVDKKVEEYGNMSAEEISNLSTADLNKVVTNTAEASYRLEKQIKMGGLTAEEMRAAEAKLAAIKVTQANLPIDKITGLGGGKDALMAAAIEGNQNHLDKLTSAYMASGSVNGDMNKLVALATREGEAYARRNIYGSDVENKGAVEEFGAKFANMIKSQAQELFRSGTDFNISSSPTTSFIGKFGSFLKNSLFGGSIYKNAKEMKPAPGMTGQPSVFIDNSNSNNSTVNNNGKTSATSSGSSGSATDFDVIFDPLVIYGGGSKGVSPEY